MINLNILHLMFSSHNFCFTILTNVSHNSWADIAKLRSDTDEKRSEICSLPIIPLTIYQQWPD